LLGGNFIKGAKMSGVEIRVRANTQQARSELKKVEDSVSNISKATHNLAGSIKRALGFYAGFVTTKSIVSAADGFKRLNNQLRLVTTAGEGTAGIMAKLNKLSIESRTSLQDTATNYSRLARAMEGTGRSSGEFLLITEAINKATKLGGQPLATQQAALFQLSQAFSSGVLRGEEFNSVSEGAPEILRALTKSLNVGRKELREMAADGLITSDVLSDALLGSLVDIRREFDLLTPTIEELTSIMQSEFARALNELDKITGISARVGSKIITLTKVFSFFADWAEYYTLLAKYHFLDFARSVIITADESKAAIMDLFSFDFNIENFRENLAKATDAVKQLLGIGEQTSEDSPFENLFKGLKASIPTIELNSLVTGEDALVKRLENFVKNVIAIFTDLWYNPLAGDSLIPGPFLEKHKENAGDVTLEGLVGDSVFGSFITKIRDFSSNVIAVFKELYYGIEKETPGGKVMTGGLVGFFDSVSMSISTFTDKLKEAVSASESFAFVTSGFISKKELLGETIEALTASYNEQGGLLGYLSSVAEKISEISKSLGKDLSTKIDETILGKSIGGPRDGKVGGLMGAGGGVETASEFANSVGNFLWDHKKGLAIGGVIATGIVAVLPAELRSNLMQGAFLGLGYLIATGLGTVLTSGITLTVAGLYFLPDILQWANENGITKAIGKKIGEGIVGFFKADGEGKGYGQRILSAIVSTMGSVGEGILEGFGFENTGALTDKLAGAVALAILGISTVGIVKNGLLSSAGSLASGLFGVGFTAKGNKAFSKTIKSILFIGGVGARNAINAGNILGKLVKGGIRAAAAGAAVEIAGEIWFSSTGDKEISAIEDEITGIASSALSSAVLGGQLGSIVPGVGTAIGAGIGAAAGAMAALFKSPEVLAALDGWLTSLTTTINDWSSNLNVWITDLETSMNEAATKFGEWLRDEALSGIKDWVKGVGGSLADGFMEGLDNIKSKIRDLFGFESNDKPLQTISSREPLPSDVPGALPANKATGGLINGPGTSTSDSIPAMLSKGEYVIQASAVNKFGPDFMSKINSGIMPVFRANGGGPEAEATLEIDPDTAANNVKLALNMERTTRESSNSWVAGIDEELYKVSRQLADILKSRNMASQGDEILAELLDRAIAGGSGGDGPVEKPKQTEGQEVATQFASSFRDGLSEALKTGDFKNFGLMLLDSFTGSVIDSFATGITESLFSGLIGKDGTDGPLAGLFTGIKSWGAGLSKKTGENITEGLSSLSAKGGTGSTFFSGISTLFSGMAEKVGGFLQTAFSGLTSGGGGFLSSILGIFSGGAGAAMNSGGIVPHTPYSKTGVDSVPTMLTPGELVVPESKVKGFMGGAGNASQTVVNLSVTGDISRQTRKEIIKMMPSIAQGVNSQNKENNYRR